MFLAFKFKDLVKKICLFTTSVLLSSSFSVFSQVNANTPDETKEDGVSLATIGMAKGNLSYANFSGLGYNNLFSSDQLTENAYGIPQRKSLEYTGSPQEPWSASDSGGITNIKIGTDANNDDKKDNLYSYMKSSSENKVNLYIRKVKTSNTGVEDPNSEWRRMTVDNVDNLGDLLITNPGTYNYYFYVDGGNYYNDIAKDDDLLNGDIDVYGLEYFIIYGRWPNPSELNEFKGNKNQA